MFSFVIALISLKKNWSSWYRISNVCLFFLLQSYYLLVWKVKFQKAKEPTGSLQVFYLCGPSVANADSAYGITENTGLHEVSSFKLCWSSLWVSDSCVYWGLFRTRRFDVLEKHWFGQGLGVPGQEGMTLQCWRAGLDGMLEEILPWEGGKLLAIRMGLDTGT